MASRVTRSRRQLSQQQEQLQQSRARWTTFLTKVLADLMVEQVREGNRKNNSFSRKAWRFICDEFCRKTGLRWDKEQLKNRYSVLRRQYALVKSLLDRNDFTWDEATGTIIASDQVWAEYIQARALLFIDYLSPTSAEINQEHADAENIKVNGCPIYKQLCFLFSDSITNGNHDHSVEFDGGIHSSHPCREPMNAMQEYTSSGSEEVDDVADDQEEFLSAMSGSTAMRKRGRKGIDDAIAGAILEMAAASKLRTAAINHCNSRYSIANCIRELDEMQLVEEQVYLAALDLFNNPNARETFLSLKGDKRLIWLRRKCPPSAQGF